jgi:hypothetical protein
MEAFKKLVEERKIAAAEQARAKEEAERNISVDAMNAFFE